ncbi:ATP-binding cassette domain-containing protein [Mucilaginibacter mali]|uniref:ATP-binding cassette domain-containing protein n=1 Tax=Mucilaginibacter mali TaxID=2740462 RepID=A0A7D4QKE3_9SPHI|nr:polysaccharide ABC transporter ATP-binding protein [Mucilaginibacter mali]QKJ30430.1 ATP-binding cassette domain-containing protein [Mucilaginibacter mali]
MPPVIKAQHLSKAYQLGEIGTGTISRDLERFWAKMRGKEDPFLKIGETNNREVTSSSDVVWSLNDLSFEIEQGDAVGIIGRNGAGKSTLLKILSRVTAPTSGSVKVKGRIASLLEVGTGFHPDLTGRENIYLNGAILGMRKAEIKRKFDEIVDFSGVERYIDTPVKRYSSGMYVRLAFAVAAHLESEIMIVDEVLAVGDAEFQRKCLGKMDDVSKGEGRTVLFVSHNMTALSNICDTGLLLENGLLTLTGSVDTVIKSYLQKQNRQDNHHFTWVDNEGIVPGVARFICADIKKTGNDSYGENIFTLDSALALSIEFSIDAGLHSVNIGIEVFNPEGLCVFKLASPSFTTQGKYRAKCTIPANLLNDNTYNINVYLIKDRSVVLAGFNRIIQFEIQEILRDENWHSKWIGIIRPQIPVNIELI